MHFNDVSKLFQELLSTSKRLKKSHILYSFYLKHTRQTPLLFDIISGNFQREISKKTLGISIKTLLEAMSTSYQIPIKTLEKEFNSSGDIGLVAEKYFKKKTSSLVKHTSLTLELIISSFSKISLKTGTNSNKIKIEILSKLFSDCETELEAKFLARLFLDDLRIGVSEGVLRDTCVMIFFPFIKGIHLYCPKCHLFSLSQKQCLYCEKTIENENIPEELCFDLETPKHITSLEEFNIGRSEKGILHYIIRNVSPEKCLLYHEPRTLYNLFSKQFEKHYYVLNSFQDLFTMYSNNKESILHITIKLGKPMRSMLGTRSQNIDDAFNMVGKPAFFDYKYDGLRVQIHNDHGKVEIFSRNLENITKQFPEICSYVKKNFSEFSFVLDGECVGYDFEQQCFLPFQMLSKRILTKKTSEVAHIKVIVKLFDMMFLNGETLLEESYQMRREKLTTLLLNKPLQQPLDISLESFSKILSNLQ
jgi:ATP-dependent DNA ligase I